LFVEAKVGGARRLRKQKVPGVRKRVLKVHIRGLKVMAVSGE